MQCDFSLEVLSDLQDGALSPLTTWRVRRHIAGCPDCGKVWRELETMRSGAQKWHGAATVPARLRTLPDSAPHPTQEPTPKRPYPAFALRLQSACRDGLRLNGRSISAIRL